MKGNRESESLIQVSSATRPPQRNGRQTPTVVKQLLNLMPFTQDVSPVVVVVVNLCAATHQLIAQRDALLIDCQPTGCTTVSHSWRGLGASSCGSSRYEWQCRRTNREASAPRAARATDPRPIEGTCGAGRSVDRSVGRSVGHHSRRSPI
eukprot:Selendium_serpulae@DN2629_c0_g1_i1.p1